MGKKLFMMATALLILGICLPLTACAQTRILADFPSGTGVEKVFINKMMLNMGLPRKEFFNYRNMFGDIQGMEVYNCENGAIISSVKSKIENVLKIYHAEVMIESEDEGEKSMIYTLFDEKNIEKPIGMAIINYEGNTVNIVILHGDVLLTQ